MEPGKNPVIAAVVLAAGLSRRMGIPKMTLPWGSTTIIGQVVSTLSGAGVEEIWVVTGGARGEVEAALRGLPIGMVYNPEHASGEMLTSLQVGLRALSARADAALVALGDQPQIEERNIRAVMEKYVYSRPVLAAPSYQMKRGHPWLVDRSLWPEILALHSPETLRDFLNRDPGRIAYVNVESPTVLQDLDTPEEYREQKP